MNYEVHRINKVFGGEAYLIIGGQDAVLIDTGYAVGVDGTIANIERHLDGRELKHIILSHSHYDHVMGAPAISEHFEGSKIYAHPRIRKVFERPNARKAMDKLNQSAAYERGLTTEDGWAEKLHVDYDVSDGDLIRVGDMPIRVIETPGHTHDSISLYFEDEELLFASESLGVPLDFPGVVPGFIVSYTDSIKSIEKARALNPKHVLLPHSKVRSGEDVKIYFDNGKKEAQRIHDIVTTAHDEGSSIDEIVEQLKDIYYKGNFKEFQTNEAFYANWVPLVTRLTYSESEQ